MCIHTRPGWRALGLTLLCLASPAWCQAPASNPGKVVVTGVVPDDATRAAIVAKLREVYGPDKVVDQIGIDKLVAPPNWVQHVQRLITPELKKVTGGQLRIAGNLVDLTGTVNGEATRQQLISQAAAQLNNPTYTVRDGLRVGGPSLQAVDDVLSRRTVEFEFGNSRLTAAGMALLDELLPHLRQLSGRRFEVIGHTDDSGAREGNVQLSRARANAVKAYLVGKGIAAGDIVTTGAGPDRPLADNGSEAGRARNRRIEFRLLA